MELKKIYLTLLIIGGLSSGLISCKETTVEKRSNESFIYRNSLDNILEIRNFYRDGLEKVRLISPGDSLVEKQQVSNLDDSIIINADSVYVIIEDLLYIHYMEDAEESNMLNRQNYQYKKVDKEHRFIFNFR